MARFTVDDAQSTDPEAAPTGELSLRCFSGLGLGAEQVDGRTHAAGVLYVKRVTVVVLKIGHRKDVYRQS